MPLSRILILQSGLQNHQIVKRRQLAKSRQACAAWAKSCSLLMDRNNFEKCPMHEDPKLEEKHLLDVLDRLILRARAAGADAADALIYESVSVSTSYRLRRLEDLERSESGDCGLRVFIGKRQAFVSSTDLSDAALSELATRAIDMARI